MARIATFAAALVAAFLIVGGVAYAASTYYVDQAGTGTDCTQADPCPTIADALAAHRVAPEPGDVIEVGPGTYAENVAADEPDDQGLTIRGTLAGDGRRQTTITGDGAGASCPAFACSVSIGSVGHIEVKLRDIAVDNAGTDPSESVTPVGLDGGSDLINVHATALAATQPFEIVFLCDERGTTISKSVIDARGISDAAGVDGCAGAQIRESEIHTEDAPALLQFSGFGTRYSVRRSWISMEPASATPTDPADAIPVIIAADDLTLDSALVTGGNVGALYQGSDGGTWTVNNTTIDVGQPGVYDPGMWDLWFFTFGCGCGTPLDITVDSSLLAEEIVGFEDSDGPGSLTCISSDFQLVDVPIPPPFTVDCAAGSNGNTTTDPADQFVGGDPFEWSLKPDAPAIDTGQPGAIPAGLAARDLAGNLRRAPVTTPGCPGTRDKGAYEAVGFACNTQPPTITNGANPTVGVRLDSTRGKWTAGPNTFKNQWLRCEPGDPDDCQPIMPFSSGQSRYRPVQADVGFVLRRSVMATNAAGDSEPATSAPTGVVGD